jgi:cytochrome P450 family 6
MSLATWVGVILAVISAIFFWIRKKYSFFADNGILHEKPEFPLGNLKGAGKKYHIANKIRENYEKYKGQSSFFGMYFFINANFVITDLELIKTVLVKDFDAFRNRGLYHKIL